MAGKVTVTLYREKISFFKNMKKNGVTRVTRVTYLCNPCISTVTEISKGNINGNSVNFKSVTSTAKIKIGLTGLQNIFLLNSFFFLYWCNPCYSEV